MVLLMVLIAVKNTVWYDYVQVRLRLHTGMVGSFMSLLFVLFVKHVVVRWYNLTLRVFRYWWLSLLWRDHQKRQLTRWKFAFIFFRYLFSVDNATIVGIPGFGMWVVVVFGILLVEFVVVDSPQFFYFGVFSLFILLKVDSDWFIFVESSLSFDYIISVF